MIAEIFLMRLRNQVSQSGQNASPERRPRFVPVKLPAR